MTYQIGDKVRYVGTAEQDVYHGELCGKVGTVARLHPWIGIIPEGDYRVWDAGPSDGSLVERVP